MVDPVMVATSGARLISEDAIETLKKRIVAFSYFDYSKYSGSGSTFKNGYYG